MEATLTLMQNTVSTALKKENMTESIKAILLAKCDTVQLRTGASGAAGRSIAPRGDHLLACLCSGQHF